jgi:hypothetical protein
MATAAWASGNEHSTDALFRVWGSELSAKFAAVGLVQTADTGQINWATATRAANSSSFATGNAGYEIWRFNDSVQAAAPIYMKVLYGTGLSGAPRIGIEVGTGSDGAGTLTGIGSGQVIGANSVRAITDGTASSCKSLMCHTEGFFGLFWKDGSSPYGAYFLCRTCDASGAPTGVGYLAWSWAISPGGTGGDGGNGRLVRFAAPPTVLFTRVNSASTFPITFIPGGLTTGATQADGTKQTYLCFGSFPEMLPICGLCAMRSVEAPAYSTFQSKHVGLDTRTFISLGWGNGVIGSVGDHDLAMIWE